MSGPNLTPYKTWWQKVVGAAIPWLAGGTNGQAEGNAWPAVLDYLLTLLISARYVAFADNAPTDALPHLGGDRQLIQGASETNQNFITRIKTAWGNSPITVPAPGLPAAQGGGPSSGWALAGTPLQVLEELWYGGFTSAIWVQQNGLAFNLSGAPTPGVDNSGLLVRTTLTTLAAALVSSVNPSRSIPAGTPWWMFDSNTDLCNRFAIFFTTPPASYPWDALALSQLQKIISTWRPNAICVGVSVQTSGHVWGWPTSRNWGSGTWGGAVTQVLSQF